MRYAAMSQTIHRRFVRAGVMVLLGLAVVVPGMAQDALPAPAPTPQPTPIAVSDIPARAAASVDAARQAVASAAPDALLIQIQQAFPDEQAQIATLREETTERMKRPGPASMIKESEKSWQRVRARLDRWMVDLSARSSALDATLGDLQSRTALWQLTRDHGSAAALPKAVTQEITDALKSLADAEKQVRSARDSILSLQAAVAKEKRGVDDMLAKQQQEIGKRTKGLVNIDSPPLWKAFGGEGDRGGVRSLGKELVREQARSLKNYLGEQGGLLLFWLLMWPALTLLMMVMRRKAEVWAQQDKSLQTTVTLLSRPASSALVVTALFNLILQPQAPSAWVDVVGFVIALAVFRLLLQLLPTSMRSAPPLVVLLIVLWRVVFLVPEGFFIHRLALLLLAAGGMAACVWLIRAFQADPGKASKPWYRALVHGSRLALILYVAGAVADIVGSVGFSILLLTGTTVSVLAAFLLELVSTTLRAMVRVTLLTGVARRMGIAPEHSDTVRTTVFRMIKFFAVLAWAFVTLRGFLLFDPVRADIRRLLDWKATIGNVSIDPGDALIFGFFIWMSFKIATFVQFVLNVEIMPKMDLPRDVPRTISRLARYAVIAVGAVIASAAAGFDISKVTIIVGALGVGVGFGLQNIVNNFVSGLILLFERPIRVGDTLDIDDTGGVVEKIGMRATIVSTWDGAEVIVPNANLISEDVTNWTLTHDRRRMIIPVGVAYGTDPEKAAQLIVEVANEHKKVDAKPEPACLFMGFGDSALEFELRAWTAGSIYLGVASDLRFTIVKRLHEAGIEIPFPQRDLHLRTTDSDAVSSGRLKKQVVAPAEDGAAGPVAKDKQETNEP